MKEASKTKKIKKTKSQWKSFKIIGIAYIIVFALWLLINKYTGNPKSIYERIGSMSPISVSIKDALSIKGYGVIPYVNNIMSGDTEAAYNMLTEEYRNSFSYEEYLQTLDGIDFETFDMKEIKNKAEGTYVATMVYEKNDELKEIDYLLYLNEVNAKMITISPDKFIYGFNDLKFKMDNIELKIKECDVYIDNINLKATVKNTSLFETMSFTDIGIGYNDSANRTQNFEFTLAPGESKEIELNYQTEYYIPNNIKIKRKLDNETLRTYTFYFDESK